MIHLIDIKYKKFTHKACKLLKKRLFVLTNKTFKFKRINLMKFTLMGALI